MPPSTSKSGRRRNKRRRKRKRRRLRKRRKRRKKRKRKSRAKRKLKKAKKTKKSRKHRKQKKVMNLSMSISMFRQITPTIKVIMIQVTKTRSPHPRQRSILTAGRQFIKPFIIMQRRMMKK